MANQFLALALFLMMLSFFIIMNGVSGFDTTKQQIVLTSVAQAFSGKTKESGFAPIDIPNAMQSINTGDSLTQLEGLFDSHIANFKASKNRLGTTMHVNLSYTEFKDALDNALSRDQRGVESFLPTMISLLRSEKSGVPYRVDIILNTSTDPVAAQNSGEELQQVSNLADSLEKAGLPKNLITAGLQQGDAGSVDLFFYRQQSYDPLQDPGSPPEAEGGAR